MNTLYTFKKQLLLTVLFFIGSATALVAQTPGIPFQAYIMDTNAGNVPGYQLPIPMVNTEILLEFTVQNSLGEPEYVERQTVITDAFGLVSTHIGTDPTNAYSNTFGDIDWDGFSKKLITRIDFTNTGDQFEPHHEMDLIFIPGSGGSGGSGSSGAILGTTPPDDGVDDPVDPVAGAIYLDTTTGDLYVFDGTDWVKPNSTPDDTSSPAVAGVSISATDAAGAPKSGALEPGDKIVVTVSMNEVVMVDLSGGMPTYAINVGGVLRAATYVSGSTTTDLVFSYTVSEGDVDTAGGVTAAAGSDALDLDGATLLDAAGNAANTSTPAVSDGDNSIVVDAAGPMATNVAIKGTNASGADKTTTLGTGDKIVVTVTLDGAATVDTSGGTPTYTINVGGVDKTATYVSGTGTTSLVFSYTIASGDSDTTDGITAGTGALAYAGGIMEGVADGRAVALATPEIAAGTNSIVVDAAGPTVDRVSMKGTNASGVDKTTSLDTGDKIVVTLTMDEAATVDTSGGTPTYTINVGGVNKTATYVSGSGTTALVFSYTVASGDTDDTDGITAGTTALALAGGTLKDAAGNNATLTTPEVVAADNTIVVNTAGPTVDSVAIKGTNASDVDKTTTLVAGDKIVVTVTMDEATTVVTTGGTPTYTIDVGGVSKTATYVSGSTTTDLVFSYTIASGDTDDADGITAGTTALALAGGTLKDAAGNNATLTTPEVVATTNSIVVDAAGPEVDSVSMKGTNASGADKTTDLETGDKIVVTVTMDEATTVVTTGGTPTYTINVGGVDKEATYESGSGTTSLVFSYTVANGDTDDTDGITAGTTALALAGGTLKDAVGNDADLTTPEVVATTNSIVVDAAGPEVDSVSIKGTNASGTDKTTTLVAGDKIVVTVTMDEATTVITTGGTPTYTIDVGGVDKAATYVSGTGTTSLVFSYTIASGDDDITGGITASTTALALAGGTMRNAAGANAALTTPEVVATTNTITVDAADPEVDSVSIKGTNASGTDKTTTLVAGDKIVVTATMSEATTVTGTPTYTIDVGGITKTATYVSGTGTTALVFSYTIVDGDVDTVGGITASTTALALAGGTLKDAVGNDATLTTPTIAANANSVEVLTILAAIGIDEEDGVATTTNATAADLNAIAGVTGAIAANEVAYQAYIDANGGNFASPATAAEVQTMVTDVNAVESLELALDFAPIVEDEAADTDVVASFTVDVPATVGFTPGTNANGYYTMVGTNIQLTTAGAAFVNGGGQLTDISLTATSGAATAVDAKRPVVANTLGNDDFTFQAPIAGGNWFFSDLFDDVLNTNLNGFASSLGLGFDKTFIADLNAPIVLEAITIGGTLNTNTFTGAVLRLYSDVGRTMEIDISGVAAGNPSLNINGLGLQVDSGHVKTTPLTIDLSNVDTPVASMTIIGSDTQYLITSELDVYEAQDTAEIEGTAGGDTLVGTAFAETITGGAGDDTLTGGGGSDIFNYDALSGGVVALGNDTITDFVIDVNLGGDQLDLAGVLDYTAGDVLADYLTVTDTVADVIIDVDANGDGSGTDFTITLAGSGDGTVMLADLEAANSLLVL